VGDPPLALRGCGLKGWGVPSRNRPLLALGLRLLAALALSTLYMLVKWTHQLGVSLPEMMFWRQFATLPLLFVWLAATRNLGSLKTKRLGSHGMRSVMGTFGMVVLFGAQILLPLPVATVLGFTTPLFAVILTALFLQERVGPWRWMAVALGFAGVIIIAQPGSAEAGAIPPLGAVAGLLAGLMVAVISLQIRDLTRTESSISVVFYFALFGSLFLGPALPFVWGPHSEAAWLAIAAVALVGTAAQLLLTAALRFGSAASVLVMDYTTLIWTTLYGKYIFDQLPPAHIWWGAPLVVAAGLVIAWREHKLHRLNQRIAAEAEAGAQ
jgi:drug/metabolite transporter (DMT)-like permease